MHRNTLENELILISILPAIRKKEKSQPNVSRNTDLSRQRQENPIK